MSEHLFKQQERRDVNKRTSLELKNAGYESAGGALIPTDPGNFITENTDVEELLLNLAARNYEDKPPELARIFQTHAQNALELYQKVVSLYGKDRVIVTISQQDGSALDSLAFQVMPEEGEVIQNLRFDGRSELQMSSPEEEVHDEKRGESKEMGAIAIKNSRKPEIDSGLKQSDSEIPRAAQ